MTGITWMCRNVTVFGADGELDQEGFAASVQRFVDAGIGVYLGSGGTGEGFTLKAGEFQKIYEIARHVSAGKILVGANPPEQHTAQATLELARLAAASRVDIINVFGPAGWHGFQPQEDEYLAFFDTVLHDLQHPVALCPNETLGYRPSAQVIAKICRRYRQVAAVNLSGVSDSTYFYTLTELLDRQVDMYVPHAHAVEQLSHGATGLLGVEANVIPKTVRQFIDAYEAGSQVEVETMQAAIQRFAAFTRNFPGANVRWVKMALEAFGLPGTPGNLRPPYLRASQDDLRLFRDGALSLDIAEIASMAEAT